MLEPKVYVETTILSYLCSSAQWLPQRGHESLESDKPSKRSARKSADGVARVRKLLDDDVNVTGKTFTEIVAAHGPAYCPGGE